jgi:hypothetical protein
MTASHRPVYTNLTGGLTARRLSFSILRELLYGVPIDYPSLARATGLDPSFVEDFLEAHAAGT